jgi:hypothetical protein
MDKKIKIYCLPGNEYWITTQHDIACAYEIDKVLKKFDVPTCISGLIAVYARKKMNKCKDCGIYIGTNKLSHPDFKNSPLQPGVCKKCSLKKCSGCNDTVLREDMVVTIRGSEKLVKKCNFCRM